jgi:hypothetical protein
VTVADRVARLRTDPGVTVAGGTRLDGVPVPSAPGAAAFPGMGPSGGPGDPAGPKHPTAGSGHPVGGATQVLSVPVPEEPARPRRATPLAVGGLAIALLAGGVGWFARPTSPHRPAATPSSSAPAAPVVSHPAPTANREPAPHPTVKRAQPKHSKRPVTNRKKKPGHGKHH